MVSRVKGWCAWLAAMFALAVVQFGLLAADADANLVTVTDTFGAGWTIVKAAVLGVVCSNNRIQFPDQCGWDPNQAR